MALSAKCEGVKQVPWLSLAEWHRTFNKIYRTNINDQEDAYKTLLVWKARISKLPIGVDCTLSILHVVLKDRDWMPKIDKGDLPAQYEEDLCLMYSTTIMRFLNHMSNIGQTKQMSLFHIAKQLNIPEWIVHLRHDTAHGHELPSIGVLRIAINTLLIWLHDEYWAPEDATMRENYVNNVEILTTMKYEETRAFADIIELWTVVGLYIHAGYRLVSNIPDVCLQETLKDLLTYSLTTIMHESNRNAESTVKVGKKLTLERCQSILLAEVSRYLGKNKFILNKEDVILDVLLANQLFLPSSSLLNIFVRLEDVAKVDLLPMSMIRFWEDVIIMLDDQRMTETFILKLNALVNNERETKDRRRMAALWINAIAGSFVKSEVAQTTFRCLKCKCKETSKSAPSKPLYLQVKAEVERSHPFSHHSLWLSPMTLVPQCTMHKVFVKEVISNVNEFSFTYIEPLLELVRPKLNVATKTRLLQLIHMYRHDDYRSESGDGCDNGGIYTVENLREICVGNRRKSKNSASNTPAYGCLADRTTRATGWKLASDDHKWADAPLGLLPWQTELESISHYQSHIPLEYHFPILESEIVPGLIESKNLKKESNIKWSNVFKQKRLKGREEKLDADLMGRAIGIAKTVIKK